MLFAVNSKFLRILNSRISCLHTTLKNKICIKSDHLTDISKIDKNSIIISQSRDIYENLAFEDWLYKNYDLSARDMFILLLWYNGPSVVIGRHQNPWIECSVDFCQANRVSIARRNSGGGTVYHDYGNLNLSFLSPVKHYNRKDNLNLVSHAISKKWPITLSVSKRDDIICNKKYKVSGTASKLGRNNAYHHCTVLVDVDEIKLHQALHRELKCVKSKATPSTKAEVINLKKVCSDINIADIIKAVSSDYKQLYGVKDMLSVYPTEELCPGLNTLQQNLMSWSWCFGHTPEFTVTKYFPICSTFSSWKDQHLPSGMEITITSKKGKIESVDITPQPLDSKTFSKMNEYIKNSRFSDKITDHLDNWVKESDNKILCKFIKCCILQMIFEVHS